MFSHPMISIIYIINIINKNQKHLNHEQTTNRQITQSRHPAGY